MKLPVLAISLLCMSFLSAEENVLRLINNFGTQQVAEGVSVEFVATTTGDLSYNFKTLEPGGGGHGLTLKAGEPISFYWDKATATLWSITPSRIGYTDLSNESHVSSVQPYSKERIDRKKSLEPAEVKDICRFYLNKPNDSAFTSSLPGLHLSHILGKHKIGDLEIELYSDTNGEIWLKQFYKNGSSASPMNLSPGQNVTIYRDSDANKLWIINKEVFRLTIYSADSATVTAEKLNLKSLNKYQASAKVIELARELTPELN